MIGKLPRTHTCIAVIAGHAPGRDVWHCYRCDEWMGYTPCTCVGGIDGFGDATDCEAYRRDYAADIAAYPVLAPRVTA